MVRVGIVGVTGYSGIELLRILLAHPEVDVIEVTSETFSDQRIDSVFPSLLGKTDLVCQTLSLPRLADSCDLVFLAVPSGQAMAYAPYLLERGRKVIDLSADFRLRDARTYEEWYAAPHKEPSLLSEAVYGLPEVHREPLRTARLVANPGCYPTSVILALAPFVAGREIDLTRIVIDSKAGVSGAGRKPGLTHHFPEVNESVTAYSVPRHRHLPEIEQELSALAGREMRVTFTPHLVPMNRGILTTLYLEPRASRDAAHWAALFQDYYGDEPFIRLRTDRSLPNTRDVRGSNECHVAVEQDSRTGRLLVFSAIDNLVKGASGQAVQCMNVMCGFPEPTALRSTHWVV